MDDVTQQKISNVIERWTFIAVGIFTTCCYTRNFLALDLLRQSYEAEGQTSANSISFSLPVWFPYDGSILSVDESELFSKVRDLRPSKSQIMDALRSVEAGIGVHDLCRDMGISTPRVDNFVRKRSVLASLLRKINRLASGAARKILVFARHHMQGVR